MLIVAKSPSNVDVEENLSFLKPRVKPRIVNILKEDDMSNY